MIKLQKGEREESAYMKRLVFLMKRSIADMFPNTMLRDTKNKAPRLQTGRERHHS